jgi:hypothetical protein
MKPYGQQDSLVAAEDPAIEPILSRFPGPIAIRSLTARGVTMLTTTWLAVFGVVLAVLLFSGAGKTPGLMLLLAPIFLPIFAVGWLGMLLLGVRELSLDSRGFTLDSLLGRRSMAWQDVVAFEVVLTNIGRATAFLSFIAGFAIRRRMTAPDWRADKISSRSARRNPPHAETPFWKTLLWTAFS